MTTRIRSDVFPANVTISKPNTSETQRYDKARIVFTMDAVYVFQDAPTGPELVYTERLASFDPGVPLHRRKRGLPPRQASAITDSGAEVSFMRTGGCGCGSRLKSFSPFSVINAVASTKDS